MPAPAFSVCVYCGSKTGTDPRFAAVATEVGQWIGRHGGQLVYGGGRNGLMGIMADSTRQAGGRVIGIIPKALVEREWAHDGCDELHVVETMHERKRMMMERADAFLALPGGIGTFEELFEVWAWRQLGYHDKPIGILSHGGYYDNMMQFMRQVVRDGFMGDWQMDLVLTGEHPAPLLRQIVQASGFSPPSHPEKL
ncbi:MAG: TIGR00730 family Rossman fold protein [Limnohabitans sp.]